MYQIHLNNLKKKIKGNLSNKTLYKETEYKFCLDIVVSFDKITYRL